ncbi:hypothetical protein Patl1_06265 [Pistacia atlantica]|uniref:Uncharacterized protein n=1 Tax=Pistacia atlantica TaxID=434234 RepID=A0ACC1BVW8_9ROSI|nr:hypothetical protein Patl1_06265 [Pistacia atlantica]
MFQTCYVLGASKKCPLPCLMFLHHLQTQGFPVDGGFIKGPVTFIVKDNLEIMPMSTENLRPLLTKKEGILELGLMLDVDGAMKLLQLSLQSRTVLTKFYKDNPNIHLTSCNPL